MFRRLLLTGILSLPLSLIQVAAFGQTTKPAGDGTTEINVEGDARVTIDDTGVHVTPSTQPAANKTGKPTTKPQGRMTIRLSNNNFGGNGGRAMKPQAIEATEAGKPTDNPLTNLTPGGIALLKKRGVDIESMQKMKAVLITETYTGAARRDVVNKDANLIVVLGKGFVTHGTVTSAGPIVAVDDANCMGDVHGDSVVWFTGKSMPRGDTSGSPVICGPNVSAFSASRWSGNEVWIGTYGMEK